MTRYDERNTQGQNKPSQQAKQDAKDVKKNAQQAASQVSEQAKQEAQSRINQGRETASREIDKIAHATRAAAADLGDQDREGLSHYVTELADHMGTLSESLRTKNVDELMRDVQGVARNNPALFIAGSLAIGLGVSRFAKSTSQQNNQHSDLAGTGTQTSEFSNQSNLYPGYSDADPESRGGANWPSSSAQSTPPTDKPGMASGALNPQDSNISDNRGGKRYE